MCCDTSQSLQNSVCSQHWYTYQIPFNTFWALFARLRSYTLQLLQLSLQLLNSTSTTLYSFCHDHWHTYHDAKFVMTLRSKSHSLHKMIQCNSPSQTQFLPQITSNFPTSNFVILACQLMPIQALTKSWDLDLGKA